MPGGLEAAHIILHARCGMDPVRVYFKPPERGKSASMARHGARLGVAAAGPGAQRFVIEIGPAEDRVMLNGEGPGMVTRLPVFSPGGIGFESYTNAAEDGTFILRSLEVRARAR